MRILHINGVVRAGSTGKIIQGICSAIQQDGGEAFIAYSGYKENVSDENAFRISDSAHVRVHQYLSFLMGDAGFHSSAETKKLIRFVDKIQPDIIHLHNIYSYYLNVEILLQEITKRKIPVVWTIHDCWLFTGKCTNFYAVGCNKWVTGCKHCPQIKAYPKSFFLDRTAELYEKKRRLITGIERIQFVCVSRWVMGLAKQSFLGERSIQCIYNGVDTSLFFPEKKEKVSALRRKYKIDDKFVILGVNNVWSKNKGLAEFIELAGALDQSARIVLVGLNPEQMEHLPQQIIGLPRTRNQDELRQWYSSSDVFVSFSKEETMGLVVVEAMACGTPVVVQPSTASPELVGEGCGLVNRDGTTAGTLACIQKIRERGKEAYSELCTKHVSKYFSSEKNYSDYVALYKTMIQ